MVDLVKVKKYILDHPGMFHQQYYDENKKKVVDDPECKCKKCTKKVLKYTNRN